MCDPASKKQQNTTICRLKFSVKTLKKFHENFSTTIQFFQQLLQQ